MPRCQTITERILIGDHFFMKKEIDCCEVIRTFEDFFDKGPIPCIQKSIPPLIESFDSSGSVEEETGETQNENLDK